MNFQELAPKESATNIAVLAQIPVMPDKRKVGRPQRPLDHYPHRLREIREQLGKSPADVARALNITPQTLNKYETGQLQLRVTDLESIAKVLGVPAAQLLNSTDPVRDRQEQAMLQIMRRLDSRSRDRLLKIALIEAQEGEQADGGVPAATAVS